MTHQKQSEGVLTRISAGLDEWMGPRVFSLVVALVLYFVVTERINLVNRAVTDTPPPVMVMDLKGALTQLMDDGMKAPEALLYTDTLMKVLRARGIVVVDAKSVLAMPEAAKVQLIDKANLYAVAEKYDVQPSERDKLEVKSAIDDAQSRIDEFTNMVQ